MPDCLREQGETAAGSAGCIKSSLAARSAATDTAKLERHFVREGRELREVRVSEATAAPRRSGAPAVAIRNQLVRMRVD